MGPQDKAPPLEMKLAAISNLRSRAEAAADVAEKLADWFLGAHPEGPREECATPICSAFLDKLTEATLNVDEQLTRLYEALRRLESMI